MSTYTKTEILNFLESRADFIAHDNLSDDYSQKEFNESELKDLFNNLYYHGESKLELFKQYLQYC